MIMSIPIISIARSRLIAPSRFAKIIAVDCPAATCSQLRCDHLNIITIRKYLADKEFKILDFKEFDLLSIPASFAASFHATFAPSGDFHEYWR